jgi:hypothetical protein
MTTIFEGGNVFKNPQGQSLTQRIAQADIAPTVTWLEQVTGLDLTSDKDTNGMPLRWLGSTGKKATSGDLDLAVDTNEISKEELKSRIDAWLKQQGVTPDKTWTQKTGISVHFRTPIAGDADNGFVQTDFMFMPNLEWGAFHSSGGGSNSAFKGAHRNILIGSIAKTQNLKYTNTGLVVRDSNRPVTQDPDQAAELLLGAGRSRQDLESVESIYQSLARDPDRDAKLADFRGYLEREGLAEPTTIKETEVNFMARLRDRIVNQGMYQLIEADSLQEVEGGKAKGIEHLEDLVFRSGSAGIRKAIDIITAVGQDPKTTTVKWDGKPAIIFGRDPDGQFVLTDVAGFTAKGYDGLFTSPRALGQQMAARDASAESRGAQGNRVQQLLPIYSALWPNVQASVPKNFRGYFHGDLLYMETPPLEAGNYVFEPNTIQYRIPADSDIGRRIGNSTQGVAVHTYYDEPGGAKQPVSTALMSKLNTVPGLLLIEPVTAKQSVRPDPTMLKQLRQLVAKHGASIDNLFDPAELRALQITDLPRLCVDYINSIVADPSQVGFENLLPNFGEYLKKKVTPKKYNNIVEYLQSPRSNSTGISAAFTAFVLLHDIKTDLQRKLDLQHPGQEGWVFSTPAGVAKAVNRFDFSRANLQRNNPSVT